MSKGVDTNEDLFKSDIFSLAMSVLALCMLRPVGECYVEVDNSGNSSRSNKNSNNTNSINSNIKTSNNNNNKSINNNNKSIINNYSNTIINTT